MPCVPATGRSGVRWVFTRWLDELPGGGQGGGRLPPAVLAVAGRALGAVARPGTPAEVAVSRVMNCSGAWVVLHGVPLAAPGPQRVAVIVEPAHPARISPLLVSAYGLTEREQELTRLVLQGHSTAEIAELLTISVHTVQQRLKSIFDKTGVRSRRDLVTNVFFNLLRCSALPAWGHKRRHRLWKSAK